MAYELARIVFPRVPDMLTNTFWYNTGYMPEAKKWDLKTMLTITTIRGILANSTSTITQQQKINTRDPGVKPNEAIVPTTFPAPKDGEGEKGARGSLLRAIDELKETGEEVYDVPDVRDVEGEWNGWTQEKDVKKLGNMSAEESYSLMMRETTSPATILYFHGGAYYLMDPKSHRGSCAKLAHLTGGRAFSVRYRLTPQHPFPAQLLDAFIAYLSLLYPPEGALHGPVKPEHIVLAGDSAGGNLSLALMLFLLHLHHTGQTKVVFHGKEVSVPLPIGVATNSPWTDITRCLPSLQTNLRWDYLPAVLLNSAPSNPTEENRGTGPAPKDPFKIPECPAWPSPPPRADLFCDGTMLCHPLVSPLAATVEHWRGVPNVFFCMGEEMLSDEGRVVAQRVLAAQKEDGNKMGTVWEGFEAMPHCFAMLLQGSKVSERCFGGWAEFIADAVGKGTVSTKGVWVGMPKLGEEARDLSRLTELSEDDVRDRMTRERDAKQKRWKELIQK